MEDGDGDGMGVVAAGSRLNSVSYLLSFHRGFLFAFLMAQITQQVFILNSTKQIPSETPLLGFGIYWLG